MTLLLLLCWYAAAVYFLYPSYHASGNPRVHRLPNTLDRNQAVWHFSGTSHDVTKWWNLTTNCWELTNHFCLGTKLHQRNTIDGRNPAITSWGKGSLSHYLQSLLHPRSLAGFLPSTLSRDSFCASTSKLTVCEIGKGHREGIPFQGWDWKPQSWEGIGFSGVVVAAASGLQDTSGITSKPYPTVFVARLSCVPGSINSFYWGWSSHLQ